MSKYLIKEMFTTLQGEGMNAGTPALFVRFSSCNLWSGKEKDRERDAERSQVECPRWCDTDFNGGDLFDAESARDAMIATVQAAGWESYNTPLVVFTGGEPLLQLDTEFFKAVRPYFSDSIFALETNGMTESKFSLMGCMDHICVSPKGHVDRIKIRVGEELKVVVPSYDPRNYDSIALGFDRCYVSPEAAAPADGVSLIRQDHVQQAVAFCLKHPRWRLSQQTHKELALR